MPDPFIQLTYSLADQAFSSSVSLGIFHASIGLSEHLSRHPRMKRMLVLGNSTLPRLPDSATVSTRIYDYPLRGIPGRLWWDQAGCYRAAKRSGNEWLFLPKGFGSFSANCPVKLAAYIHDLISVQYRSRYPGTVSSSRDRYYRATHRRTLEQARVIFTSTECVRTELIEWSREQGIRCPPVEIAGYGFPDYQLATPKKRDQILVMTRNSPHKRTDLAVAFTERWRKETRFSGKIICAGTLPDDVAIPSHDAWSFIRKPPSDRLHDLIRESRVLIHFTELEGFGMPPVESILLGTPAVYSSIPVTSEVMGETGLPFANGSYAEFAGAMTQALAMDDGKIAAWSASLRRRHNWTDVTNRIMIALERHT